MGDDASDFTFCQVATNLSDDVLESPKIIPDIGVITISNATNKVEKDGGSTQGGVLADVCKVREASNSSSSSSQTNGSDKQAFGGIMKCSTEIKPVTRKPVARAKVPFEKGYSQMDWLKVTRTHPDLAGLKGQSNRRLISMDEVRQHKKEGSVWTVLKGRVYNISPYMKFHPGGVDMLMKAAGKDCTSLFNKYHAWVNAEFLLEKCLVGVLDDSQ